MEIVQPAAAPAQADPVPPPAAAVTPDLTPTQQAVVADDFGAFRSSKREAEKAGKDPLAPTAPAAAAPVAVTPPAAEDVRQVSKRQQQINDYERRLAEQSAEIERLRTATPPARSAPVTPAPAAASVEAEPDPTDTTKYPDGQYDAKFIRDLSAHAAKEAVKTAQATADTEAQTRARADARTKAIDARDSQYATRMTEAKAKTPDLDTRLSDEVKALRPRDALGPDEPVTPLNDVAEAVLASAIPDVLMLHFSEHPEELRRFEALHTRGEVLFEMGILHGQLRAAAASTPPPKTITDAPTPPLVLGSRPTEGVDPIASAVARDDFAAFRAAKRAQRAGGHR